MQANNPLVSDFPSDPILPDRTAFARRLRRALDRHGTGSHRRFAVLFVNIDRFRVVNATYGPRCGDELLEAVARRLRDDLRPADQVARDGGDRFWALLNGIDDRGDAIMVADRLYRLLHKPFAIADHNIVVTASIGIAMAHEDYTEPEEPMRDADVAMDAAKNGNRSSYAIFTPDMLAPFEAQVTLETELRQAIEDNQFELRYQPLVDLGTRRVVGFETLLRWRHPRRGLLTPPEFLDGAIATGLIVPIGWWVLETACAQLHAWRELDPAYNDLVISVNLARRQFSQWVLPQRVARVLEIHGLPGGGLQLELSGADFADQPDVADEILTRLKSLGVKLQLDDFGVGPSTLASLRRFPLDSLKIDGALVNVLQTDARDMAIARHLAALAHALDLELVAGGVETQTQARKLRELGCTAAQGYLFAKPMPADSVSGYLARAYSANTAAVELLRQQCAASAD